MGCEIVFLAFFTVTMETKKRSHRVAGANEIRKITSVKLCIVTRPENTVVPTHVIRAVAPEVMTSKTTHRLPHLGKEPRRVATDRPTEARGKYPPVVYLVLHSSSSKHSAFLDNISPV